MSVRKKSKKNQINLLPKEGFSATVSGRVLLWALSTFRIVVIVTEIIVMIAFLSRFWLDAQHTDLNEKLEQKKAVLEATSNFETEFKNSQQLISIFSKIIQDKGLIKDGFTKITSSLPKNEYVVLDSIVYEEKTINLTGTSPTEESIQQYVVNLHDKDIFDQILINTLYTDEENSLLLHFDIDVLL